MKTKLYRTITLVLAIVILLGVTPTFAAENDSEKGPRLTAEDYDNHNYIEMPYNFNVSADQNGYIPFSALWEYGNRTSASSKLIFGIELEDGVCYVDSLTPVANEILRTKGINVAKNMTSNMTTSYFGGNTYLKTVITANEMPIKWFDAPELKLAIFLHGCGFWGDWTRNKTAYNYITPSFPRNVTVISGLIDGEMTIANSTDFATTKTFKSRAEYIEAVRPILASAHLTDRAWSMIPTEFGGKTEANPVGNRVVSDWAKDEYAKARLAGITTQDRPALLTYETGPSNRDYAAEVIINTYEAVCKTNNVSTGYPSVIPEVFGPNGVNKPGSPENIGAYLGIFKGDGETYIRNGKTYNRFHNDDMLTREQMAAMLTRFAKACGKTLPSKPMPFTDAMSDWAVPEVSACYGAGLIKGTSATTFGALDNITREQVIVLCYRMYVYLTK